MTRNILLYILFFISFNFLHAGEVNYGGLSMIQWPNGNINSYNSTDIVNNAPVFHQHFYHYLGGNRLKSITSNGNETLDPLLPIQSNNRTFGYDVNGNVNKDTFRQLKLYYGRGNLPYLTAKNTQRTYYAYNTADSRIFKGDSQQGLYYMSGTGVLDLATNQWEYYPTAHTQIKNGIPYFLSLDHLGNIRAVVAKNIIEAQYDYYPYGKILRKWENIGSRYLSTKHEKDKETGYDDRKARWYDEDALGFLEIDPLADKFMGWSPYNYVNRNPLKFIDPDGKSPINVTKNDNGTYTIVGGNANSDRNIYVLDNFGKRTGESIGMTLTNYSFFLDNESPIIGAIIDPSDKSGVNFLNKEIINSNIGLYEYASNAYGRQVYDFKSRNIENKQSYISEDQYRYRGMPIENVVGFDNFDGVKNTYASARDIGNIGAGYIAGMNGLSWGVSRFCFDALESVQVSLSTGFFVSSFEKKTTQFAEKIGYQFGFKKYQENKSFMQKYNNLDKFNLIVE